MELLRAKSDAKKLIFRKLFHTELYAQVTEELANRRREKERELAIVRTMVQTAVARVSVPGDYERAELLSQQKERVLFGELSVMEAFLEDLRLLCSCLKKHCQEIKNECEAVVERRDQVKAVAVEAEHIEKLYVQLHQAEKDNSAAAVRHSRRLRGCDRAGHLRGNGGGFPRLGTTAPVLRSGGLVSARSVQTVRREGRCSGE